MTTSIQNIATLDKAIKWNRVTNKYLFAEGELYQFGIPATVKNIDILESFYETVLSENNIKSNW